MGSYINCNSICPSLKKTIVINTEEDFIKHFGVPKSDSDREFMKYCLSNAFFPPTLPMYIERVPNIFMECDDISSRGHRRVYQLPKKEKQ